MCALVIVYVSAKVVSVVYRQTWYSTSGNMDFPAWNCPRAKPCQALYILDTSTISSHILMWAHCVICASCGRPQRTSICVSCGRPSYAQALPVSRGLATTWLQLAHSLCFCVELIPCKNANAIPLHWCLINAKIKNQMPLNALLLSSKVRWVDVHWQAVESQFILLKAEYEGHNSPLCAYMDLESFVIFRNHL